VNSTFEYEHPPVVKNMLSVALIGPDEKRRRALAAALERHPVTLTGEYGAYPNYHQLAKLGESGCDVVIVDLDPDPEAALDLVENICSRNLAATVMVYSATRDPEVLVRCMRAGAREFLSEPISADTLAEAVIRATARRLEIEKQKKLSGRVLVFCGAKGGAGVTTLASNFAIALKQEAGAEVALIDLKTQLGDVAVVLGLTPHFTIADALHNSERLDQDFVSSLLVEHRSGVAVLASPDQCSAQTLVMDGSLRKLLHVLRSRFPFVVVDGGSIFTEGLQVACEMADSIYLVTQAEIPALRNAQRLIAHFQQPGMPERRIEMVLNRFDPRKVEIQESRMAKVLPLPLKWKVPNDYFSVCRSLNTGAPLALENSSIAKALRQMARQACGKPVEQGKKKRWGLFE
jgi:pilus assembly protein CpaE